MIRQIVSATLVLAGLSGGAGARAIHDAVQKGHIQTVTSLLNENPEVLEERDNGDQTPLQVAAAEGQAEIAVFLLQNGASMTAGEGTSGGTPMHLAAANGHLDLVKVLIANGASLDSRDDRGMTPLHSACYQGQTDVADFLVAQGADVNALTTSGSAPLHGAAYYGHPGTVRFLIEHGAHVAVPNRYGYQPLHSASAAGHLEIVKFLVEYGADVRATLGEERRTALHEAAMAGNPQLVEFLISLGADPNGSTVSGQTALHWSCHAEDTTVAGTLIAHGADVNVTDINGSTPLHWAARGNNRCDYASLFIDHGADVNAIDNQGCSPLQLAVVQGSSDVCRLLVLHGADLGKRDKQYGRTVLHHAAIKGDYDLVQLLLDHDAASDEMDKSGATPVMYSVKYAHPDITDLLAARGAKTVDPATYFAQAFIDTPLSAGEACVWYLGHCGYAVKTINHLLVFDYWNLGPDPANPCLANGHIIPEELAATDVTVFVTHDHQDHLDTSIFAWDRQLPGVRYIYGFDPLQSPQFQSSGYNGPEYTYVGPHDSVTVDSMTIVTIEANDAGVGFLITVDGVSLYHAGDHAGWAENEKEGYTREIDSLANRVKHLDLAFLNTTGCHSHDTTALFEGTCYTLDKLKPEVFFPTHAYGREYAYEQFAQKLASHGYTTTVALPQNRGDAFIYRQGRIQ
jgi:ankyrin repeat protein/L-ascorbate metabolism protein UlaG (beta-lactamase superfamily)